MVLMRSGCFLASNSVTADGADLPLFTCHTWGPVGSRSLGVRGKFVRPSMPWSRALTRPLIVNSSRAKPCVPVSAKINARARATAPFSSSSRIQRTTPRSVTGESLSSACGLTLHKHLKASENRRQTTPRFPVTATGAVLVQVGKLDPACVEFHADVGAVRNLHKRLEAGRALAEAGGQRCGLRSEEHTSELQSRTQ